MSEITENTERKLPKVGIIIANYNYGQWIVDAVKSAAIQDYPEKVIVVIDDLSTDNSFEVVRGLCNGFVEVEEDEDKKIFSGKVFEVEFIYIQLKKNGGPSRARNIGIKFIWDTCQIFSILDADDALLQGKISKCVAKILEYPEVVGGVYTDYLHLTENGVFSYESKEGYSRERLIQECIVHSGCTFSKLAISKVGLYEETLRTCEDYNLWLRISNYFIFTHIPEYLHLVRIGNHQSSITVPNEVWEENYRRGKMSALGLG